MTNTARVEIKKLWESPEILALGVNMTQSLPCNVNKSYPDGDDGVIIQNEDICSWFVQIIPITIPLPFQSIPLYLHT